MSRRRIEVYPVIKATAIGASGSKDLMSEFPLGEGWLAMNLRFLVTITNSTGSGVLAQAMARIIRNVLLETDRDGIIVNAPGRFLFQRAIDLLGATPHIATAFAATTGTYDISIPIHFADPRVVRPEDTLLHTARYQRVSLNVQTGSVADLVSTAGDMAITGITMSVEVVRYAGQLGETLMPTFAPQLIGRRVIDPNTQAFVDLDRSPDLAYKRIALFCSNSATPGLGNGDDAVLNTISIEDQDGFAGWNQRLDSMIQAENKEQYGLESYQLGRYVHDYVGVGGSNLQAELAGNKSKYQVTWTNDTPSGKYVQLFTDGYKTLKA